MLFVLMVEIVLEGGRVGFIFILIFCLFGKGFIVF